MEKSDRTEYFKQYYREHAQKRKDVVTKWRSENPDKVREYNRKNYLKRKAAKNADK